MDSEVSGFYKKTPRERLDAAKRIASLSGQEASALEKGALDLPAADKMIENVVGIAQLPLGLATNFLINGKDLLVPYALEEPSVVAGASKAAKIARFSGGFITESTQPVMIGQVQLVGIKKFDEALKAIEKRKAEVIALANSKDERLLERGGGAKGVEARVVETKRGKMVVAHLLVDCRDAMGANAVNTMCEAVAPFLEEVTGGEARLRIVSNLAVKRLARAKAVFRKGLLSVEGVCSGEEAVERILDAQAFAEADEFRACTHNKGVMNGVDAVAIACGQDWRAIEAGAHAYASLSGKYSPLTRYSKNAEGNLCGEIELPVAVGIVGGAVKANPAAQACLKILGVKTARELAEVLAAVGLAQNFSALLALATEGIQKGHMRLHERKLTAEKK